MHQENPTTKFLLLLFQRLSKRNITYCILRNYENLPDKVGNDIDIWIKDGEQGRCQECLFETAKENNWELVKYSSRPSLKGEGDYFYANNENDLTIIHLDCWTYLYWRGLSYIDEDSIPSNLTLHKNGFWKPAEGIEASILLLKDLLYHKNIPDKYRKRIHDFTTQDAENFVHAIQKPFGKMVSNSIVDAIKNTNWEALEKDAKPLRRLLIKRGILKNPLSQIKKWIIYLYSYLKKYLFPCNGVFLVLIGPDGSGKSTTANNLLNVEIRKLFQKKQYFHGHFSFLPELKQIFSFVKQDNRINVPNIAYEVPHNEIKPFGVFRAIIYPLYYGIDYFLGHFVIWIEKARGGLVLFDRYFYDYFIQKPYENCPRWLLLLIAKIIPTPDILIFLKNDPETIHDRKPELTGEEIVRQSKICDEIVKRSKNGFVIETSLSPDEVVRQIQGIIVDKIRQKAKRV